MILTDVTGTIFAYIRVSSNLQNVESQLNEVKNFCKNNRFLLLDNNIFIDEGISGTIPWTKRKIFTVVSNAKKGDVIVIPEISRLGRNMDEINTILITCREKKVTLLDIKYNLVIDDSLQSKMMSTMLSMFSEMERKIISDRTKQGLIIARKKGHLSGRYRGVKPNKLDSKKDQIIELAEKGYSYRKMAQVFSVNHSHVRQFMISRNLLNHYKFQHGNQIINDDN